MGKLSAGFDLGTELRTHRKAAGLTQPDLATKAGLAERTVRALEQGSGTLDSWDAALDALGLSLAGRNLPGGTTLGERLATLRRRRGLSQEELGYGNDSRQTGPLSSQILHIDLTRQFAFYVETRPQRLRR